MDQDALGLTWEKTIRQAINSVSLRNAQEVTANSDQYDSLNQLIVSELEQANRSDLLLDDKNPTPSFGICSLGFGTQQ